MSHPFRNQPLKFLYISYFVTTLIFVRLPLWTISFALIPKTRPRRAWSIRRSIMLKFSQIALVLAYQTGIYLIPAVDPLVIPENPEEAGYTLIEPVSKELVRGEVAKLAELNGVEPARISGYWFGLRGTDCKAGQKAGSTEKIVYYLHGGGYVNSSVKTHVYVYQQILRHCTQISRVFSLEYRSSSAPPFKASNPFPAALFDAVAGYHYLVHELGFNSENIIISGDSAGAHLALDLTRYIQLELSSVLLLPKALLLISAYCDMGRTLNAPNSSIFTNRHSDMIYEFGYGGYNTRAFLGKIPPDSLQLNPYFSPASLKISKPAGLFKGFPTTCLVAGEAEMLRDPIRTLRDRMVSDMGEDNVRYLEWTDACHDFMWYDWYEPENTEAWIEVASWMKTLWL